MLPIAPAPSKPIACSSACAASRMQVLAERGARELEADREALGEPDGIEMPGRPASDIGS